MICYCGKSVRTDADVCRHDTNVISSMFLCGNSFIEWYENCPDGRGLSYDQSADLACVGPWPRLCYYGPANWSAISYMCPILHQGKSGYVYHLLDNWASALYIGKSKQPSRRIPDHQSTSWWNKVKIVRIFSSTQYHSLETADIKQFHPRYNIANTTGVFLTKLRIWMETGDDEWEE